MAKEQNASLAAFSSGVTVVTKKSSSGSLFKISWGRQRSCTFPAPSPIDQHPFQCLCHEEEGEKEEELRASFFDTRRLPNELWFSVFGFLQYSDVVRLRRVNHHLKQLASNDSLWQELMARIYGPSVVRKYSREYIRKGSLESLTWYHCAIVEFFYRKLVAESFVLYRRETDVFDEHWTQRKLRLCGSYLTYTREFPRAGLYLLPMGVQLERGRIKVTKLIKVVVHDKVLTHQGMPLIIIDLLLEGAVTQTCKRFAHLGTNFAAVHALAHRIQEYSTRMKQWRALSPHPALISSIACQFRGLDKRS